MNDGTKWGGPAFPGSATHDLDGNQRGFSGMRLRDYFAGKCVSAMILQHGELPANTYSLPGTQKYLAKCAYEMADAMLAERDK